MNYKSKKDLCCRTIYNLELYMEEHSKDSKMWKYENTQMVNSFLGLLVVIVEETKGNISTFAELDSFVASNNPKKWDYPKKDGSSEDRNFANYIAHLRNSMAHGHTEFNSNTGGEIESLTFLDKYSEDADFRFKACLTVKQIKELIKKMAEVFLADYNEEFDNSCTKKKL